MAVRFDPMLLQKSELLPGCWFVFPVHAQIVSCRTDRLSGLTLLVLNRLLNFGKRIIQLVDHVSLVLADAPICGESCKRIVMRDPLQLPALAEAKEDEDFRFRTFLKHHTKLRAAQIDELVFGISEQV